MRHEAVLGSASKKEIGLHIVGLLQTAVRLTVKIRALKKRIFVLYFAPWNLWSRDPVELQVSAATSSLAALDGETADDSGYFCQGFFHNRVISSCYALQIKQ